MGQLTLGRARRALLAAFVSAAALCAHTTSAHAARGLTLGIYEPDFATTSTAAQTQAFANAAQARAGFALVYVNWSNVAPNSRPPGFDATNPADPRYQFQSIDDAVRDATARGMKVLLAFVNAPAW